MLTEVSISRRATPITTVGVLAVFYAVTFFAEALLHLGVRVPSGFAVLAEPQIFHATILEGLTAPSRWRP